MNEDVSIQASRVCGDLTSLVDMINDLNAKLKASESQVDELKSAHAKAESQHVASIHQLNLQINCYIVNTKALTTLLDDKDVLLEQQTRKLEEKETEVQALKKESTGSKQALLKLRDSITQLLTTETADLPDAVSVNVEDDSDELTEQASLKSTPTKEISLTPGN